MNTLTRRLAAGVLTALAVPALALPHASAEPGDGDQPTGPAPTVTARVPATNTGWYADSVLVEIDVSAFDEIEVTSAWTVTHDGDPIASGLIGAGTNEIEVSAEGTSRVEYSVNASGGGHHDGFVTVKVDATEPAVSFDRGAISVPVGSRELVGFGCADALSGPGSCVSDRGGSPALLDTSTPGRHVLTVTATDAVGNAGTSQLAYDVIAPDTTAPTLQDVVTSGQRQNGWWTTPVGFRFTAEDPVVDHQTRTGVHHLDVDLDGVVSHELVDRRDVLVGEGRHVLKWAAADNAGNASGIESMDVNVDTVRPQVDIAYPRPGQRLTPSSPSVPTFGCDDAGSGVTSCEKLEDGGTHRGLPQLDLTPGRHTLTVRAIDAAGWVAESSVEYVVDAAHPVVRSSTTLSNVKASRTHKGSARVQIAAGHAPRGTVVITDGARRIATVAVPRSAARAGRTTFVVSLPRLARGRHVLRATYQGAADVRRSASRPVVVRVR